MRICVIYKVEKPIAPIAAKDSTTGAKKTDQNLTDKEKQATSDKKLVAESSSSLSANAPPLKEEIYTVKPGDYFYKIAREHSISVEDLLKINGLNRDSKIAIGQKLKLNK